MEALIVDGLTYSRLGGNINSVYNTMPFAETNRNKVDEILYIVVYKEDSPRFGCVFGVIGDVWKCPFSAPFGYIEPLKKGQSVWDFEEALCAVESVAKERKCAILSITLPPTFYSEGVINTWYAVMISHGWKCQCADINFAINLQQMDEEYMSKISYNARKNLKKALKLEMSIKECLSIEEKKEAYEIIQRNREYKGYPLRMTEEQVLRTIEVVPAHVYMVSDSEKLAAALVYDVTSKVSQVIYWGDVPECQGKNAINYLSYELVDIYLKRGMHYLDIGPSTENGVPNYGLCNFKDSIGCERAVKFSFSKEIAG